MATDFQKSLGEPLMTIADAAEWCNVSEKTIRRAIKGGKLEAVKVAGLIRIHPEDLLSFVEGK